MQRYIGKINIILCIPKHPIFLMPVITILEVSSNPEYGSGEGLWWIWIIRNKVEMGRENESFFVEFLMY